MKLEVPVGLHNEVWVEKAVYYYKIYIYCIFKNLFTLTLREENRATAVNLFVAFLYLLK